MNTPVRKPCERKDLEGVRSVGSAHLPSVANRPVPPVIDCPSIGRRKSNRISAREMVHFALLGAPAQPLRQQRTAYVRQRDGAMHIYNVIR